MKFIHFRCIRKVNIYVLVSDKIHSDLSDAVISTSILTSYIPIPPSDVNKLKKHLIIHLSLKQMFIMLLLVYTWVDLEPEVPHPFEKIGEIVLELPLLEWETLFNILEEIKDFFQENLC